MDGEARKRLWGWYSYDWASQPYHTLLLTFIFGPYLRDVLGDGALAQTLWGRTLGTVSLLFAASAPFLGLVADNSGRRLSWIRFFSLWYVVGSAGLWWAFPDGSTLTLILISLGVGIIGLECTTMFSNALMPNLIDRQHMGKISASGWAVGYLGGLVALLLFLAFFAENDEGLTLLMRPPVAGLDPVVREGTRFVGPFTAIWFVLFMIPFFAWIREGRPQAKRKSAGLMQRLRESWQRLRSDRRLLWFLISSMFYRDALNGVYVFAGIYSAGVLGWSVVQTGGFGILTLVSGALFAWLGGFADLRFGSRAMVRVSQWVLLTALVAMLLFSKGKFAGLPLPEGSRLPDMMFYLFGALVGGFGGILQSSSRAMMIKLAPADRVGETCGLYALSGKATAFLAPLMIAWFTSWTGSQQKGVIPLPLLFLLALWLLRKVPFSEKKGLA